jgi:phenylpropionate dioxygenase-like ring-hydroxylating dioxygenase large terminal subunit
MFIKNCWYVAGWGNELTTTPLARTLLNEPVVLFRGASGRAFALEDRCCHKNLPLSFGAIQGDCLACGYHGLVYDGSGKCVQVPGQEMIPPGACVRGFPLEERDGLLWFWPGDLDKADVSAIPSYPIHSDPRWAHKGSHYVIGCHYELMHDNLIDLSHVGYVHGKTIGGTPSAHSTAQMQVNRLETGAIVRRFMPDSVPPPTYVRAVGFKGHIDRWMEITFVPGLITIYIGANEAGKGYDDAGKMDSLGIRIFNGVTPETEISTHYFWTAAHNFRVDEPEVTKAFHSEIAATFEEDRNVVEAQQRMFQRFPNRPNVNIRSDAGGIQARRVIQLRMQSEQLA